MFMSKIKCPSCGKINYDINDRCTGCKADLRMSKRVHIPVTICNACNNMNIGAFQYCAFCGGYLKNMDTVSVYDKEELVLARHVADLQPEEALFYSKENNLLNKELYIRKISQLEGQLRRYKGMLDYPDTKPGSEPKDFAEHAIDMVVKSVKNKMRSFASMAGYSEEAEEEFVPREPEMKAAAKEPSVAETAADNKVHNDEIRTKAVEAPAGKTEISAQEHDVKAASEAFAVICRDRFFDNMMFSQLKPKIENRINAADEYALNLLKAGKTPEQTAYFIISDTVAEEFSKSSGCYLFKSVLSTKGKEYFRAWEIASQELLKNGGFSQAEYDEAVKRINETIQNNG
jgi:hypothetical protein